MKIALFHGQALIRELLAAYIERSIDAQVFQVTGIDQLLTLTSEHGPFDLSIINCPPDLWGNGTDQALSRSQWWKACCPDVRVDRRRHDP